MKKTMLSLALCGSLAAGLTTMASGADAAPGGCLKYGAAGAVAGHMVHHGIRGAIAGCAAGMYRRHLYNKQMREQKKMAPTSAPVTPLSTTPAPAANPT